MTINPRRRNRNRRPHSGCWPVGGRRTGLLKHRRLFGVGSRSLPLEEAHRPKIPHRFRPGGHAVSGTRRIRPFGRNGRRRQIRRNRMTRCRQIRDRRQLGRLLGPVKVSVGGGVSKRFGSRSGSKWCRVPPGGDLLAAGQADQQSDSNSRRGECPQESRGLEQVDHGVMPSRAEPTRVRAIGPLIP